MTATIPPITHSACNHHVFGMGCVEYDMLSARAAGHCELCGVAAEATTRGALVIDHDHRYDRGGSGQKGTPVLVRGLVCDPCNWTLGAVDKYRQPPTDEIKEYFKRVWFVEAREYKGGGSPFEKVSDDWRVWQRFNRAARLTGNSGIKVLQDFARWYARERGYRTPRRPAQDPNAG
jgi:hypothetical protein